MIDRKAVDDSDRRSGGFGLRGSDTAELGVHEYLIMLSDLSCVICQPRTSRDIKICCMFVRILESMNSYPCSPSIPVSDDGLLHK